MGCGGSKTQKPSKQLTPSVPPKQSEVKHQPQPKINQPAQNGPISMPIPPQAPKIVAQSQIYPGSNIFATEKHQVQAGLPPINEESQHVFSSNQKHQPSSRSEMILNKIYHIEALKAAKLQLLMIQNNMMNTLLRELPQVIKQLEKQTKAGRKKDVESYNEQRLAPKNVYEYLEMALQSAQPLQRYQCKLSYHLQEDIVLILETSLFQEINEEAFERIVSSKKLFRSIQSIRERYYTHIDKIQQQEIAYICKWIKNYGVCGFASFNRNNFIIIFLDQQTEDSSTTRPEFENIDDLDYHKQFIKSNSKQSQYNRKQLQILNKAVNLYAKLTNKTVTQILRLLDQSSGDFVALEAYLETKNPFYLWSSYEDKVLRYANIDKKIKQSFISSIRPLQKINQRMNYLGIQ